MENNINNYNNILGELYNFYNDIKNYVSSFFAEKYDRKLLEIDFNKDFAISNNLKSNFIFFDKNSQKFLLSIPGGISKYSDLKDAVPLKFINAKDKMENNYYSHFTDDELSQVVRDYDIDFMKYVKSEFLHEYIKKILDLEENENTIHYSDDYVECSENSGFIINDIIVEMETRMLAQRFGLLYVPTSIGNDYISRKIHLICLVKQKIILNGNTDELFRSLSYFDQRELIEFEEEEFEKKYNLKRNSLRDEKESNLMYKSFKQRKYELLDELKKVKREVLKSANVVDSYGFASTSSFMTIIVLVLISLMGFVIFCMIFRR